MTEKSLARADPEQVLDVRALIYTATSVGNLGNFPEPTCGSHRLAHIHRSGQPKFAVASALSGMIMIPPALS
jgi:hypothetical protein